MRSEVPDEAVNLIVAQMLFFDAEDPERDITLYINSPGDYNQPMLWHNRLMLWHNQLML